MERDVNGWIALKKPHDLQKEITKFANLCYAKRVAQVRLHPLRNKSVHDIQLTKEGRSSSSMMPVCEAMYISVPNVGIAQFRARPPVTALQFKC